MIAPWRESRQHLRKEAIPVLLAPVHSIVEET